MPRKFAAIVLLPFIAFIAGVAGCQSTRTVSAPGKPAAAAEEDAWSKLRATYLAASRAEHDHRLQPWRVVRAWNFDDGHIPTGFRIFEGVWEVRDGALMAVGGKPENNRIIGISPMAWPSFRVAFDAVLTPRPGAPDTRIGDIGVRLGADPETASFAQGYVAILAHYANQAAVIYRLNIPLARTEFAPIRPGQKHHILVEYVKPHIRIWVDDHVVLDAWERAGRNNRDHGDFLEFDASRIIALHTWDTDMRIDNLEISVPAKD